MGDVWETDGRCVGNRWEVCGKQMGGVWETLIINFKLNFCFKVKFSRHLSNKVRPKGKYTFDFITLINNT